jgi:hypothetical protein
MATVDKNFRIKNGLVVEGTTATVNGENVITDGSNTDALDEGSNNLYYTESRAKADAAALLTSSTKTNISITGDGSGLVITAENGVADSDTDDLNEGTGNLYFTDARALSATAAAYDTAGAAATAESNANSYTDTAVSNLVDSSPETLDTLNELAAALGDDPSFATTVSTNIGTKVAKSGDTMTGELALPSISLNSVAKSVAATGVVATAGTATAISFAKASYRSAEFFVKASSGAHTEMSKVLITLDTSDNISITEYGIVSTNGSLASVSADISGTDVRIRVTTVNSNTTVTAAGTLLI